MHAIHCWILRWHGLVSIFLRAALTFSCAVACSCRTRMPVATTCSSSLHFYRYLSMPQYSQALPLLRPAFERAFHTHAPAAPRLHGATGRTIMNGAVWHDAQRAVVYWQRCACGWERVVRTMAVAGLWVYPHTAAAGRRVVAPKRYYGTTRGTAVAGGVAFCALSLPCEGRGLRLPAFSLLLPSFSCRRSAAGTLFVAVPSFLLCYVLCSSVHIFM